MWSFFTLLSLAYVFVGLRCLYRVVRSWRSLWDAEVTPEDARLASQAAFFLLIPPAVALHELGHAALIWAQGLEVLDWQFLGYMGWVTHRSAGPLGDFAIAIAGNVVTLAIGLFALSFGVLRPGHPVRNILSIELGRQSLFLVLFFYPLICLAFPGDFVTIYDFRATPIASSVAALIHGLLLAVGYGIVWKRHWRGRSVLLASPYAAKLIDAQARVRADDGDLRAHRELGLILYAVSDFRRAREHLEKVIAGGAGDPRVRAMYGGVLVAEKAYDRAVPELEAALEGLLRPEERLLAELPLATALIELRRYDETRARLDALTRAFPKNAEIRSLYERLPRG